MFVFLASLPYSPFVGSGVSCFLEQRSNPVLAQKDAVSVEPRGVSVDLAHELGRRMAVPVELITYDAAGKVFDALKRGAWDVAIRHALPKSSSRHRMR